jgi:hypothetical protein
MEEYTSYKEWLFWRVLLKISAYNRIHPLDIKFVKHSLNKKFEKLTKNGWIGKPFSLLKEELENKAELLVSRFEDIDKHINEELNNQLIHLTGIQIK